MQLTYIPEVGDICTYIPDLGDICNIYPRGRGYMLQYTPQIGIMCVLVALYTSGVLVEKSCTGYIPINGIYIYIYIYIP